MSKRSLLQKYDIPLSYLDFEYIEKCTDGKRMEKIFHILESGEEGWYPDLQKCAADKLAQLRPNSKFLRTEQKILTKADIEKSEWLTEGQPVIEWSNEVKLKDNFLSTLSNVKTEDLHIPPVRHDTKKIDLTGSKIEEISTNNVQNNNEKSVEGVASTDYRKWDKYDAETEVLKMDLDEERNKELIERMNKKNLEKSKNNLKNDIEELDKDVLSKLTNVEKETLSVMYKDRGNELFKAKEYENCLVEYTKSLEILPSAAGYNNRAVAYLKLLIYSKCVQDCDKCLQIEPKNIKALLRKGQAFLGMDKRRDAYEIYAKIISIEPSNVVARNCLNDLKKQLPDLPPTTATRITIKDEDNTKKSSEKMNYKIAEVDKPNQEIVEKYKSEEENVEKKISEVKKKETKKKSSSYNYVQEDLSKLIIPKKIVKNKMLTKTLETMQNPKNLPNKNDQLSSAGVNLNKPISNTISSEMTIPDGRSKQNKCERKRNMIEEIK